MASLFDLDYFLEKAEREFLLQGNTEFTYPIRITQIMKANSGAFEKELARHSEIVVTEFSDRRVSGLKVGLPSAIRFDVNFLLKNRAHLMNLKIAFDRARSASREINVQAFLERNYIESKKKFENLESAVKAANYLLENRPTIEGLFPRQIPHGQSTKLLVNDTLVRRILSFHLDRPRLTVNELCEAFGLKKKPSYFHFHADEVFYDGILLKDHHSIITDTNIHRFEFQTHKPLLIVENEETFHAAHGQIQGVVIFGNGDKAASLSFLTSALRGNRIFYWGDIDKSGYEILANVHKIFPDIKPVGMGMDAVERFWHLKQDIESEEAATEVPILQDEYKRVCAHGIQIEQEQLPLVEILSEIRS